MITLFTSLHADGTSRAIANTTKFTSACRLLLNSYISMAERATKTIVRGGVEDSLVFLLGEKNPYD